MKSAPLALIAASAAVMSFEPLMPAGSLFGPIRTKLLYITGWRLTPKPSDRNFSSAGLAWTNTTSASPRRAVSSACPVPCATTFTSMPVLALNIGRMWPNRPESCVEVVEATTIDLSCAEAWPANTALAAIAISTRRDSVFIGCPFQSNEQFAREECPGLGGLRPVEERRGSGGLHDAAAVKHDDVTGEPARFAEIMGRHHDLDIAFANRADDVFHRLGGGRIEARGRLVQEQHGRIARQRPCQRQPLLFATGQPSRGAIGETSEPDQFEQFTGAARMLRARDTRRTQREADIGGSAAPEHRRTLKHDRAFERRGIFQAAPGGAPVRRREQPHRHAQQRGFSRTVGADQHGRWPGRQRKRDIVEDD